MDLQEITISNRIDELESVLLNNFPKVDCPLKHEFREGVYIRTIFMPAGTNIVSQIHRTRHEYEILEGSAYVKINEEGWELLEAPFKGITEPGTRRILIIENDCVWRTFHYTDIVPEDSTSEAILKAVQLIGQKIIEPHENKYLGGQVKNNYIITKDIEYETRLY